MQSFQVSPVTVGDRVKTQEKGAAVHAFHTKSIEAEYWSHQNKIVLIQRLFISEEQEQEPARDSTQHASPKFFFGAQRQKIRTVSGYRAHKKDKKDKQR